LGYEYLANHQLAQALDIFKLNVEAHPNSGDAYDSLAEAYMVSGDKNMAIKFYKRSVELNPSNKNGIEMLKSSKESSRVSARHLTNRWTRAAGACSQLAWCGEA